jgi:LysR family transcriptional regulator, glycine cleavage system transcriptional activator
MPDRRAERVVMDRARRIAELWAYLPAFRSAAETEHLPSAGRALFVTPSAVSRTIRTLEISLGLRLFERAGRGISLNPAGRRLLSAVRDAMRLVDDAVASCRGEMLVGEVAIATPRELALPLVWPALRALLVRHPGLVPRVAITDEREVRELLLRGDIDLALVHDARGTAPDLAVELLAPVEHGVYAPSSHPLVGRAGLTLGDLADHRFVAPTASARPDAPTVDHWPPEHPRRQVVRVPDPVLAADAAIALGALVVLSDLVGAGHPEGLARIDVAVGAAGSLHAVTRAPVGEHARTQAALSSLRDSARALAGAPRR